MHSARSDSPAAVEEPPDNPMTIRRARDAAAYREARVSATASMRELLALLLAGAVVSEVQPQARATMSKVAQLWEAAAHLSEHE